MEWRPKCRVALPCALFASEPPDQTQGDGGLALLEDAQGVREEEGLVGPVASPFFAHQEALGKLVFESSGSFFESLSLAGVKSSIVRQVFTACGECDFWRELITKIGCSTIIMRRRRGGVQALDDVIDFCSESEAVRGVPGRIAVEDMQFAARGINDGFKGSALKSGKVGPFVTN